MCTQEKINLLQSLELKLEIIWMNHAASTYKNQVLFLYLNNIRIQRANCWV